MNSSSSTNTYDILFLKQNLFRGSPVSYAPTHRYLLCAWRKKHTDKIYAWGQTDFRNTSFELTKAAYAHLPKTIVGYM